MNLNLITSLLLILGIIPEIVRCIRFNQKRRASSEDARRQRADSVVACLECGADLVRVDRRTEMDFTPFVDGVWPKPVKVVIRSLLRLICSASAIFFCNSLIVMVDFRKSFVV